VSKTVTDYRVPSPVRLKRVPGAVLIVCSFLLVARRSEFVSMEGFSCGRRSISI
jgi:hypothetical protein